MSVAEDLGETQQMKTSRTGTFEMKDPFLVDYKQSLQEVIKGMKNVGSSGTRLLIVEMIRSRWIKDKRATYPYEAAWVFDRNEEAVSKILKAVEVSGDVELVGRGHVSKGPAKPYRPRSLRKIVRTRQSSRQRNKRFQFKTF